jgi:hypothetical protein
LDVLVIVGVGVGVEGSVGSTAASFTVGVRAGGGAAAVSSVTLGIEGIDIERPKFVAK